MKIFRQLTLAALAAVTISGNALAGGLLTNTNQSASFLRSIARGTTLDPDAVLHNPAGLVFNENGLIFGISDQMAYQTRTINSTFAPYAMNANSLGQSTKEYEGTVFSPIIPSFHLAWKHNRWAVMVGMGVNGGGGSLEFKDGLASFERQFSVLPAGISNFGQSYGISASQYAMDMYLKGSSMTLAFNAGVAFRITDWLAAAAQIRLGVTNNSYEGHMKNIQTNPNAPAFGLNGTMMPAPTFFGSVTSMLKSSYEQLVAAGMGDSPQAQALMAAMTQAGTYGVMTSDHILDLKQTGTSISPVLALSFHKGAWDASVKYEFKMGTELEIESEPVSANDPIINSLFPHGTKVKSETPALLAVAASRQCGDVKVTLEWHHYFDKDAENSFTNIVNGNTNEFLAGVEWKLSERLLLSCGAQRTQYDLNKNLYSDMNFTTSNWTFGLGAKYIFSEKIALNAGIMKTFYEEVTSLGQYSGVDFKDLYDRTSTAWGLGVDFKFGR